MLTTLMIVLPIFAMIGTGFVCRKMGVLGPHATGELNRFVVYLALPALLLDIMAHATWAALYQPGFIAVFGLSSLTLFAGTVVIRCRGARHLADAGIDGLNVAYCNVGFIGFPLCLTLFGKDSLAPTTVATIITVCVVFALAIVIVEAGLQGEARPASIAWKVGRSLGRNPLLVAPALGVAFAASGVVLPASVETFLRLLGGAASPCALVALGLFLAEGRPARRGETVTSTILAAIKLLLHPALALAMAAAWRLPAFPTHVAVVLAALPTGTGPFMLAEFYGREASVTSKTILISTVGSLLTITAYFTWVA